MKIAALDLGSNTSLMLVAEVSNGTITHVYRDELVVTRMGQGVNANGKFHPEALSRLDDCLAKYAAILKTEKPDRVLAMATSAARDVSNADELFTIGKKHGFEIQIIPGEKEAAITFSGATNEFQDRTGLCVIDVGGGSTEIIAQLASGELVGQSVDVGSVRLTEMFITQHPTPKYEVEKTLAYATEKFNTAKLPPAKMIKRVIAVAGTPTTLAAVLQNSIFNEEAVNGYVITAAVLEEWLSRFAALDLDARMKLTGMNPKRADVIVAGCAILLTAIRALGANEMTVSTRGVRYGVALYAAQAKI